MLLDGSSPRNTINLITINTIATIGLESKYLGLRESTTRAPVRLTQAVATTSLKNCCPMRSGFPTNFHTASKNLEVLVVKMTGITASARR
jgi:hypothetical protein